MRNVCDHLAYCQEEVAWCIPNPFPRPAHLYPTPTLAPCSAPPGLAAAAPKSHMRCITKEKTALFIPNAIAIITSKKEYIFRSFWDREDAFKTLKKCQQESNNIGSAGHPPHPAHALAQAASMAPEEEGPAPSPSQEGEGEGEEGADAGSGRCGVLKSCLFPQSLPGADGSVGGTRSRV